jgi:putative acetyltransferase
VTRIRAACLGDAPAICAIHKRAVRLTCSRVYTRAQIRAWIGKLRPRDFARAMALWNERMLVALRRERVVGFASVKGATLYALYVDPRHGRGSEHLLLRAAEQFARRRGSPIVGLSATLNAVGFYLRTGYRIKGMSTVRRSGKELPVVEMAGPGSTARACVSRYARVGAHWLVNSRRRARPCVVNSTRNLRRMRGAGSAPARAALASLPAQLAALTPAEPKTSQTEGEKAEGGRFGNERSRTIDESARRAGAAHRDRTRAD